MFRNDEQDTTFQLATIQHRCPSKILPVRVALIWLIVGFFSTVPALATSPGTCIVSGMVADITFTQDLEP
jgi:hypothetical protein